MTILVPELLITFPSGRTTKQRLDTPTVVVGRDATCELVLDDPSTSRRHARFTRTPEGYVVEDLDSKNGTLVNDQPCMSKVLVDGDEVLIGAILVVYSDREQETISSPVIISDEAPTANATKYVSKETRLDLSERRLKTIYELNERLTTLKDRDQLLEDAMSICLDMLQFERGAIGVKPHHQRGLDWPVVRNLRGASGELTISQTLLNRALEHGERAIFTGGDSALADPTMSIVQHGIRSAMCVPLLHHNEILGVIYGDRQTTSRPYTSEDVDFLAGISQLISIGLINARLVEEQRQMARLEHDMKLARRIQTGLLPKSLPNQRNLKVTALNEPGQRVSGDYYDVILLDDGCVWCIIADVTGEGIAAALLMANLQAAVRLTVRDASDPGKLLTLWNRLIFSNTDSSKFITCLCALIDPNKRSIRLASAGHHVPFMLRSDDDGAGVMAGLEVGFPLGVMESTDYETHQFNTGSGPYMLFCYTDGVTEAMNEGGEPFGGHRLSQTLTSQNDLNPAAIIKQLRKAITQFVGSAPQSDDITMLAAKVG